MKEMRNVLLGMLAILLLTGIAWAASPEVKYSDPFKLVYGHLHLKKETVDPPDPDATYANVYVYDVDGDNGGDASDGLYIEYSNGTNVGPFGTGTGTVSGSGTDNHVSRFNGTGNIQDSDWVLSDVIGGGGSELRSDGGAALASATISSHIGSVILETPTGTNALSVSAYGDTQPVFAVRNTGAIRFGPGGSTAYDTEALRLDVGLLGLASGDAFAIQGGGTDFGAPVDGTLYYRTDTDVLRLRANGAWVSVATGAGYTSWTLAGDSGSSQTISDGDTATIEGDVGIDTVAAATDKVKISIDSTVTTLTGSQTLTNKTLTTPILSDPLSNGMRVSVRTETGASYTLVGSDCAILYNYASGTATLNLPAAASNTGRVYYIRDIATAQNVTIDPNGTERLDGSLTVSLTPGTTRIIISDGTNWFSF